MLFYYVSCINDFNINEIYTGIKKLKKIFKSYTKINLINRKKTFIK